MATVKLKHFTGWSGVTRPDGTVLSRYSDRAPEILLTLVTKRGPDDMPSTLTLDISDDFNNDLIDVEKL